MAVSMIKMGHTVAENNKFSIFCKKSLAMQLRLVYIPPAPSAKPKMLGWRNW